MVSNIINPEKKSKLEEDISTNLENKLENESELKTEFIAVYSEMKPSIKDLKFDKQIDITFKSLGVGFKAAQEAYRYLSDYQKALNQIDSKSWVTTTNGRTEYDKDKLRELAIKLIEEKENATIRESN
jgi:hypothetical protein